MLLKLQCIAEDKPGEKWRALFNRAWPFYRHWFLSEGILARKGYLTSVSMLQHHMPELMPVYEQLVALAGDGDLEARFLTMYAPPKYMTGCSQMVLARQQVSLVRNYDYNPKLFEGNMLCTHWLKPVIGMSDCVWGLLDGINGDGLALSLAFGGRKEVGDGFGIPLILRYLLETTSNVAGAIEKLKTLPVHMVYTITLVDKTGHFATVYLSPDRAPVITESAVSTNHQGLVEWQQYAEVTATEERKHLLERMVENGHETEDSVIRKFLHPPLFNYNYETNFGTLYTVDYRVTDAQVKMYWPDHDPLVQSFESFAEDLVVVRLSGHKGLANLI